MEFYTYIYLREDKTPYYVGKGKGIRWKRPHSVTTPPDDRVIFFVENTTEDWAHFCEMFLIDYWGRLNDGTGILENLTDGGEGTSGRILEEDTKNKISASMMGHKGAFSGKKLSETHKERIAKGREGKKQSEEAKQKLRVIASQRSEDLKRRMGEKNRGKRASKETRELLSKMKKGKVWWNNGKEETLSKETPGPEWKRGRRPK